MLIYKIFLPSQYAELSENGSTRGAPIDIQDGYVHFSTAAQLHETLSRHFKDVEPLHLLAVDAEKLDALRWEPSRGGDLFPHLYRDMRSEDVLWSREIRLGPQGHETGDLE